MKASEAVIAWNGLGDDYRHEGRPASIAVGPLLFDGDGDWTRPYLYTGGAAEVYRRNLSEQDQKFAVLKDFYTLVQGYGLHPSVVHRAFLHIDEYRDIAKDVGAVLGHDAATGDEPMNYPTPAVEEERVERSFHFWLAP